jgi:16S rRNA (cytidine1402-2'-O)-methyltransferase
MSGKLYLIPSLLGNSLPESVLPEAVFGLIKRLHYYIVEDIRSARRFLKKVHPPVEIDKITFFELNKYTDEKELPGFLAAALSGHDTGLITEAGVPCVADPGSKITSIAHMRGIQVVPVAGPSSVIMALMASGLNGQKFAFHGYLPVKQHSRIQALKRIEQESVLTTQAQIFMETPYRNMQMLETLTSVCDPASQLCIACDITLETEFIMTRFISEWKKNKPDLHKRPAIFILQGKSVITP